MLSRKPVILVIDDSPEILVLLERSLAVDFLVRTAKSGAEGFDLAMKAPPDLILLDVIIPDTHGFDVFRKLRAAKELRNIPVMFISGSGDLDSVGQGLALGAADYLVKPFNISLTRQRISNLLEREQLRKDLELHRDQLQETVADRTRELSVAKKAAEAANHAKSVFLAKVSNELRSPMTAILGMTDLAMKRAADDESVRQLDTVKRGSEHLLTLINDLVDLSRIEVGSLILERRPFRLGSVTDKVVQKLSGDAAAKGLALTVEIPQKLAGCTVEGDPERLGQILLNLVSNAIKFTERGCIGIRLSEEDSSPGEMMIRLEVWDTGIGISKEMQQRLFRGFEQADSVSEGLGLGLAICRRLANMMNGTIGVEASQGVGSTFWVTGRLFQSAELAALEAVPRPADISPEAWLKRHHADAHILLAGNDPITSEVVAWMLDKTGIRFDVSVNTNDILQKVKETAYDAIMIDVGMLAAAEVEIVKSIRAMQGRKHTVIIGMTGKAIDECRQYKERLGITDWVEKPIDGRQLFEALLQSLDNHKTGQALNDQRFQMLADIAKELEGDVVFPICLDMAIKVNQQLQRKKGAFNKVVSLIELDPLIACKLVRLANSLSKPGIEVRDLKTALISLGEDQVRSIVSETVATQLPLSHRIPEFEKMAENLWQHSIDTAAAAFVLARRLTKLNPDECLLAGLVHDLGAFYMLYRATKYSELRLRPDTVSHLVWQWHESIGLSLLNALKMPEAIVNAVSEHNQRRDIPKVLESIGDVVYVANLLTENDGELVHSEKDAERCAELDVLRRAFDAEIKQQATAMREALAG
ncbi:MAG: response regulator [Azonexus sp.]|nr:response regulator [Azonexus sp.]